MTTRLVPLPTRRSKAAPRFDLDIPLSLWDYFVDYEVLAEAAQLDDITKVKQSVIYLDRDEAEFWKSLKEYSGSNWQAFKNAVLKRYPGSIPNERWMLSDLDELCSAQKTKQIQTRGDFAKFDRIFSTISTSLISMGLLSELEKKKSYWNSLDPVFRDQVVERVKLSKPAYMSRTILTIAEIWDAASLVLDGTLAETSSAASQKTTLSIPAPSFEPVKEESFSMDRFAQQMAAMMAQTVEKAIAKALDQAMSINAPSVQMDSSQNSSEAFYSAHVNERIPVYPRNEPWVQKVVDYRVPNTAAFVSKTNAIGTTSNLAEVGSEYHVETHVESKRDLDAHIAALQWRISRQGDDDDDEGLEDVIQDLKARVKKTMGEVSSQGPQEKRAAPFASPSITVRESVLPKPAPAPVPPIPKVSDQPYRVHIPCEVLAGPAEALDLSRNVTEAVSVKRVEIKDSKKDEVTPSVAVYAVKEDSRSAVAASLSRPQEAHTSLSEPNEALVEENAIEERKNLENQNEELLTKEDPSHDRIVFDPFEERDCPPLFPMFESHRNDKSPLYSHSPHVELSTLPSMCLIALPVPSCHSTLANPLRSAFVESSVIAVDQEDFETKDSRPHVLKKIAPLPGDPKGEDLARFRMSQIVVPTPAYLEMSFHEASLISIPYPESTLSPSIKDPYVFPVEFPTVVAATPLVNKLPVVVASPWSPETQKCRERVLKRIAPWPPDTRNEESVQIALAWSDIPARSHLETLPKDESLVRMQIPDSSLSPKFADPLESLVELPTVVAATLPVKESSIAKPACISQGSQIAKEYQRQVLKKIAPSFSDPRNEALAQFAVARIDVPNPDFMPSPSFTNPHALLIELPTRFAATFLIEESSFISASQWNAETKISHQWIVKTVQLLCKARSEVSVQLEIYRIVVPCRPYPAKLPHEAQLVRANPCPMFIPKIDNSPVSFVKVSTVFASSLTSEQPTSSTVSFVRNGKITRREKNVQITTPEKTCADDRYPFVHPVHFPTQSPHIVFVKFSAVVTAAQPIKDIPTLSVVVFAPKIAKPVPKVPMQSSAFRLHYLPFISTSSRLQMRLVDFQGYRRMQYDVELEKLGHLYIDIERNDETELRYIGAVVVIRKTNGGVWILAETDVAVGNSSCAVSRCRPYRVRSLDAKNVAKIAKAERRYCRNEKPRKTSRNPSLQ